MLDHLYLALDGIELAFLRRGIDLFVAHTLF